ncbi:hypothetical protein RCH06_001487 [Polaromonas sp. CG_9.5]|uniref:hypothetical protein n=1 Tax=Polaromonas sp. CG_9.5 TaxID=3071705 RepID=UPI002DFBAB88|nr:hypothetical protein [Polaromonas sp. CG_9.5]
MTTPEKWTGLRFWAALLHPKPSRYGSSFEIVMARGLCLGLVVASFSAQSAPASEDVASLHASHSAMHAATEERPKRANFEQEQASPEARDIANWVVDSADNHRMPFAIVDKAQAKVFVFDAQGQLRGATPALLGLAIGDDSVPGIGQRKLSSIRPEERTTPAGRFVASLDLNLKGEEILWVDYETAISMHRVITSNAKERRAQRLASASLLDKRISYGCINVPVNFYNKVLSPAFTGTGGIVYVLPETRSSREVFGSYDVGERARLQAASPSEPQTLTARQVR